MKIDDQLLERLRRGYEIAARALVDQANADGYWTGELSASPLSTATAVAALHLVGQHQSNRRAEFDPFVQSGLTWLSEHQNPDGGWGDTVLSHSNISTTTLAYASFVLTRHGFSENKGDSTTIAGDESGSRFAGIVLKAKDYIDRNGGFEAIRRRYGKDRTFSVPILTQCALAGLLPWRKLTPLPFELAWLPHWFYKWIRLPVVSYALPALIAIGQVRHHLAPSRNPLLRLIRNLAVQPTLRRLASIQPESGGFLEATPLTSFVTMSLASMNQADHAVCKLGVDFLKASMLPDGSWPIDTNLATWVTTLSVNALHPESFRGNQRESIATWLLRQQYRVVHRYTNADPGGWAWTNLSGGVPDADDTPGAILALLKLDSRNPGMHEALVAAVNWLLDLQNSDGGWPTFCRGWGALPFDRSAPDLTAHCLRALRAWLTQREITRATGDPRNARLESRVQLAVKHGFGYLAATQRTDGAWLPLWFGNQFVDNDENPVYGTGRVLAAYRDWGRQEDSGAIRAISFLAGVQNSDGGWGGAANAPSSTEETAIAVEALVSTGKMDSSVQRGLIWLLDRIDTEQFRNPAPIGLYFAKLWYFERLYPIIFTVAAMAKAVEVAKRQFPAK